MYDPKKMSTKKKIIITVIFFGGLSLIGGISVSIFGGPSLFTMLSVTLFSSDKESNVADAEKPIEPILIEGNSIEGELTNENPEGMYYYDSTESGLYSFTLQDMNADTEATLQVLDKDGNTIDDNSSGTNSIYPTLDTHTRYLVKVKKLADDTHYEVKVSPPSEMQDITGKTEVSGSTQNEEQSISYAYKPSVSGIHYFVLNDRTFDNSVYIEVFGKNNSPVDGGNDNNSVSVYLEADEYYRLELTGSDEPTNYTLQIGTPHPTVNLTDQTSYSDKISYQDQENYYTYTAPRFGTYRFDLANRTADNSVYIELFGKNDSPVENGDGREGVTVLLHKAQTYKIKVSYDGYEGVSYDLKIGVPDPLKTLTSEQTGKIRYIDQKNTYSFTPKQTARYSFSAENRTKDQSVYIEILTKNESSLGSGYSSVDADEVMKKGKEYYINVEYSGGELPLKYLLTVHQLADDE